jgi:hypothetical protein
VQQLCGTIDAFVCLVDHWSGKQEAIMAQEFEQLLSSKWTK